MPTLETHHKPNYTAAPQEKDDKFPILIYFSGLGFHCALDL